MRSCEGYQDITVGPFLPFNPAGNKARLEVVSRTNCAGLTCMLVAYHDYHGLVVLGQW